MEIQLTGPQTQFMQMTAKYPLFVAGFGSGKSLTMVLKILDDLSFPGARIGAYAPTYDLLKLITITYLEEFLTESQIPYKMNKSSFIMDVEGYGPIILRSMDNPGRIVGYQTFRAHIDELDTMREVQATEAWNKIIARNRQKIVVDGVIQTNKVSAYTTPEGFKFAYKRWVKNKVDGYELVRAPTRSNPHLPPDYIESLRASYPAQLIDAYLEGEFVNLTSGQVYRSYDRKLNDTEETVQGNEPLFVGMDFNVMKGCAIVHVLRNGQPHAVDEIVDSFDTDHQILTLKQRYQNNHISVFPDAAGKSRTSSNTTETDLAKLKMAGYRVVVDYSNPLIKDRVYCMNAMLCNGLGERRYKVNIRKCPNYAEALEQQVYDTNGVPDKSSDHDHKTDAGGYYIAKEFPIRVRQSQTAIAGGY